MLHNESITPTPPPVPKASHSEDGYTIQLWQGIPGFRHIQADWQRLLQSLAQVHFYQSSTWYRDYLELLASNPDDIYFCTCEKAGKLIGVLPLHAHQLTLSGMRLRVLELPKHLHLTTADAIFDDSRVSPAQFARWLQSLRRQSVLPWDCVLLSRVPEHTATSRYFRHALPSLGVSQLHNLCSYLPCDRPFNDYADALSGHFRRNLRRLRRRAESQGRLSFHSYRDEANLATAFTQFIEIEASGWKGEQGERTALRCDPAITEFYRRRLHNTTYDQCIINTLMLGEECVAAQFAIQSHGILYLLKIGYHDRYAQLAPGNLLMEHVWQHCCEDPTIHTLSFMTNAAWNRDWNPRSSQVLDHYFFNHTLRGYWARWIMRLRIAWRRKFTRSTTSVFN